MAKKYKENSVYYYQIIPRIITGNDEEVETAKKRFKKAFKFKNLKKTVEQGGEGSVSAIEGRVINKRYIGGAVIYTQESNLPPKVDNTGINTQVLELNGFKGLGYDSAYFYDSELMVLAIESRVPGPTLASLQSLIYVNNQQINTFDYKAVASANDYDKFLQSDGAKSLEMQILSIKEKPIKNEPVNGVEESINILNEANAAKINIEISTGQKKLSTLRKEYLKGMADYALKSFGCQNEVSKFKMKIIDIDSGKIVPIDLITGRIKDKTKILKVRAINRFSISDKIDQLEGHYLRRRPNIETVISL